MRTPPTDSMTVGELKELLENYEDDTQVMFSYNYGDYWRTRVAGTIGAGELKKVEYSDYHDMNKLSREDEDNWDDDEDEYDDSEDTREVLILN